MRVVIDFQALQTASAIRGIGRYTLSIVREMLQSGRNIEFIILLNDQAEFFNNHHSLLDELKELIGEDGLVYFPVPENMNYINASQITRRVAELTRERFIDALKPDVLLISSLFEFDAITSVQPREERSYLVAVILYDLIPLSDRGLYLANPLVEKWYFDKLEHLKKSDLFLSISQHSLDDAVEKIGLSREACINVSGASNLVDYHKRNEKCYQAPELVDVYQDYVLYVGGFDSRKNVDKLIKAFADQPFEIIDKYSLILAGKIDKVGKKSLQAIAKSYSLPLDKVIFLNYVNDDLLIKLYKNCSIFVFPSSNEGFGLPPLEAMGFGAPVIAANRASLPEVIGNNDFLFNPDGVGFSTMLTQALTDERFRIRLIEHSKKRFQLFSWLKSSNTALDFIEGYKRNITPTNKVKSHDDFFHELAAICESHEDIVIASKLYARLLVQTKKIHFLDRSFIMTNLFQDSVPDFTTNDFPYVFSSGLCREQHFHLPLYTYWCRRLGEHPKLHRKQWEFVYICQVLHERGYLRDGASAVGFGVGKEPLVPFFCSQGVGVLGTDLDLDRAVDLGWATTDQHSNDLLTMNEKGLCEQSKFLEKAEFRNVDMNDIPSDLGRFDFCWSSCAFEHLGSIRKGLDFVLNSAELLKPGGIAVHTTEFNISSNDKTLDNNPAFVIFRKRDIEQLVRELAENGYEVETVDFSSGEDELERYVDLPPYIDEPHLRLQLAGEFTSTSVGIIIKAPK